MSAYLDIHEAFDGGWVRLRLTGELDLASAPQVRRHLARLRADKRLILLDLSGLEFMDVTGIHVLTDEFNDADDDGAQLAIDSGLSAQVHRLFELAGLDHLISDCAMDAP